MSTHTANHIDTPEKSTPEASLDATENTVNEEVLSTFKLAVLLGSLTLVTYLVLLDTSIIGTAIPHITTNFQSLPDVGWYVGAYTLAAATLQPLSGKFYANFNNKVIYLAFVFAFEFGSLLCGVAKSSVMFIVGRAIAGLGASGLINGSMTILAGAVPIEKSPMYTGALLGIAQLGVVSGPLIGGVLTEYASWKWCFYINLPVGGIAALILIIIQIPETTPKPPFSLRLLRKVVPELDLIGFALFVPASILLLLALQFGNARTYSWDSATVIGLFCGAAVSAVIFIMWERKMGEKAMLPGPLFGRRIVWTSCLFAMFLMACLIVASNWVPTYFQAVRGDGPTMSGVHVLPGILAQLLCVVLSGVYISRLGYYLPLGIFSAAMTAIGNGLISTFTASTSVSTWIGYQIIAGAGRGAGMQLAIVAIQNAVKPADVPIAIALVIFTQNLGTSISVVLSNTLFTETLTSRITTYAPSVSSHAALEAGSGAGAVRALVIGHEEELDGVLRAYSESFRNVFYFLVGAALCALVVSPGMGWKDVRKKAPKAITQGSQEDVQKLEV
ncbi:efflux pump protein [Pyrenochaeta sp. DS3sAY3a]|nr:efflux pump protein [Pyrenochaeta sp. DS3sAY3a]